MSHLYPVELTESRSGPTDCMICLMEGQGRGLSGAWAGILRKAVKVACVYCFFNFDFEKWLFFTIFSSKGKVKNDAALSVLQTKTIHMKKLSG